MNAIDEPDLSDESTQFVPSSPALGVLQGVLTFFAAALGVATLVGAVLFVVPTLTGSAKIWQEGRVSGLPIGGDLPMVAATAEGVTERLDLPGTDRSGRFVVDSAQASVEVEGVWLDARMVYDDPSLALRIVVVLGTVLAVVLAWSVLVSLIGVVGSARHGEPFSLANVKRLRWIGTAGLLVWIGDPLFSVLRSALSPRILDLDGITFRSEFTMSFSWLIAGAAGFALAEIFAHGRRLHLAEEEVV